jgi:signal transduction histidine kinase/CheY-like chemotaxis protein
MHQFLKKLLLAGTLGMPAEDQSRVIVVNALSLLTIFLALTMGMVIFANSWDYGILAASCIEAAFFSGIILLNQRRKHILACIAFLLFHNLAVLYFGAWRQMAREEELLTVFLCITAALVFKPLWQTALAWALSICVLLTAMVISHYELVAPQPLEAGTLYHDLGLAAISIMTLSVIYWYDATLNHSLHEVNAVLKEHNERLESTVAERTKNVKHFARSLMHEVRTELSAQLTVSSAVDERIRIKETSAAPCSTTAMEATIKRMKEKIKTLHASSLRLMAIVNNTLNMAKIESGIFFDLNVTCFRLEGWSRELTGLMQLLADDRSIKIELDFEGDLPEYVLTDRQLLDHAVRNLLMNAIKFSPDKGIIHFNLYRTGGEQKPMLWVEIMDQGPGIGGSRIKKIFEPYVTEGSGGTGLGLAMVKIAVSHLDGKIDVDSVLGLGSAFRIAIPLVCGSKEQLSIQSEEVMLLEKLDSGQDLRILIADDDEMNRVYFSSMIKQLGGCVPVTVNDGRQCLDQMIKDRPDMLLLDANMPGMDGGAVMEAIRNMTDTSLAQIPVVVISADASTDLISEFSDFKPDDFLFKPCTTQELCECLNKVIHKMAQRLQNIPKA